MNIHFYIILSTLLYIYLYMYFHLENNYLIYISIEIYIWPSKALTLFWSYNDKYNVN